MQKIGALPEETPFPLFFPPPPPLFFFFFKKKKKTIWRFSLDALVKIATALACRVRVDLDAA